MTIALLVLALLLAAGLGAVSVWYFGGRLEREALIVSPGEDELDLVVKAVGPTWIELRPLLPAASDWNREGRYRLVWKGGTAPVGPLLEPPAETARRSFQPPPSGGPPAETPARLDAFAFGDDPLAAHGLAFEEVMVTGELGDMPAWLVPGDPRRWAIMVHGKGANRREALRALPVIQAAGATTLVISYRNDEGAPGSPDRRYAYGRTEWRDLEAAVGFARRRGANSLLLVGYSMGGAIVLSFMARSREAAAVEAIVLEAPVLSLASCIELATTRGGLPRWLSRLLVRAAAFHRRIPLREMDFRDAARALQVPVLLLHGSEDDRTPAAESARLAADRPDTIVHERFEGAGHVRAWNLDPQRYEQVLRAFLDRWRVEGGDRQRAAASPPPSE